jgi:hypothetical protein
MKRTILMRWLVMLAILLGAAAPAAAGGEAEGWSTGTLVAKANAYASAGDTGHAILALERARLLSPADETVAKNLTTLRERAGVEPPEISRVDRVLGNWPADHWTWFALGSLGVAAAGVAAIAWTRRRKLGLVAALSGMGLGVATGAIALRVAPDPATAVVVSSAPATLAPFDGAEPAFTARAGERVELQKHHAGHVYVRADADRVGWLPETAVETVIPTEHVHPGT